MFKVKFEKMADTFFPNPFPCFLYNYTLSSSSSSSTGYFCHLQPWLSGWAVVVMLGDFEFETESYQDFELVFTASLWSEKMLANKPQMSAPPLQS
jgi:hypothetical protein